MKEITDTLDRSALRRCGISNRDANHLIRVFKDKVLPLDPFSIIQPIEHGLWGSEMFELARLAAGSWKKTYLFVYYLLQRSIAHQLERYEDIRPLPPVFDMMLSDYLCPTKNDAINAFVLYLDDAMPDWKRGDEQAAALSKLLCMAARIAQMWFLKPLSEADSPALANAHDEVIQNSLVLLFIQAADMHDVDQRSHLYMDVVTRIAIIYDDPDASEAAFLASKIAPVEAAEVSDAG